MSETHKFHAIQIWIDGEPTPVFDPLRQALERPSQALVEVFKRYDPSPIALIKEMFAFVGAPAEEYSRLASRWDTFRREAAASDLAWDSGKGPYLLLSPARDASFGLASATLCSRCQTIQMTVMQRNTKFPAEKGCANRFLWVIELSFNPHDAKCNSYFGVCCDLLKTKLDSVPNVKVVNS